MADELTQRTRGLLDALVLTPIGPMDSSPTMLDISVRGLPGFHASLEVAAVRELQDALGVILGPRDTAELVVLLRKMFEVYDRPLERNGDWKHADEFRELEAQARRLVGAPQRAYEDA